MPMINNRACVVNGTPVDKVFSDGRQVYSRNLVIGTSNELKSYTGSGWGSLPASPASGTYGAGKYYVSAYIENTTPVTMVVVCQVIKTAGYVNIFGSSVQPGKSGISSLTLDILEEQSLGSIWVSFKNLQTSSYTYKYKEMMVKRDQSAWTPAPEDILK